MVLASLEPAAVIVGHGRILYANPSASRLSGFGPEELAARSAEQVLRLVQPHDRNKSARWFRCLASGEPLDPHLRLRIVGKDGATRTIDTYGSRIPYQGAAVALVLGLDVTPQVEAAQERDAAVEALREHQARLESILDTLSEGVALNEGVFDADGVMFDYRVLEVNRAFLDTADYVGPVDPIGRLASDLYRLDADEVRAFWHRHAAATEPASFEHESHTRKRWFSITTSPIVDGKFVTSFHDITERKRREREHQAVQERTHAVQRLETVGRLAGGVAHDFNNILGAITAHVELLAMDLGPGHPSLPDVEEIRAAAQRGANVTRQLLGFARSQPTSPAVVSAREVAEGVARMLRPLLGADVELVVQASEDDPRIEIDRGQLEQVLSNLVVNAADATDEDGHIRIEIDVETVQAGAAADLQPGQYVRLSVTDDGIGMSAETRQRIFEPFFSTKEVGRGTGLGLAIVYGVVSQNRGSVSVHSEPGAGTCVSVLLPRSCGDVPMPKVAAEVTVLPKVPRITVLVVDDNDRLCRATARLVAAAGHEVMAATSPAVALQLVQEHSGAIDVLLTDIVMPEIDGLQLARKVRALRPNIRVLLTSGYPGDSLDQDLLEADGVRFLGKPFTCEDLHAELEALLAE